jgi:hypothetical protein
LFSNCGFSLVLVFCASSVVFYYNFVSNAIISRSFFFQKGGAKYLIGVRFLFDQSYMKHINNYKQDPLDAKTEGLHINPLEFLAAIINLWLVLKLVAQLPANPMGYSVNLLSDNTSALSWMQLTAQTRDPCLQPLAGITSTMLVVTSRHLTRVQPKHIPGNDNFKADTLSPSENGQVLSWERVIS